LSYSDYPESHSFQEWQFGSAGWSVGS
jgi:hypothetical protein